MKNKSNIFWSFMLLLALAMGQFAFMSTPHAVVPATFRETAIDGNRLAGLRCIFDKLLFPKPPPKPLTFALAMYGE